MSDRKRLPLYLWINVMSCPRVTPSSGNVFLDLGFPPEEAAQLLADCVARRAAGNSITRHGESEMSEPTHSPLPWKAKYVAGAGDVVRCADDSPVCSMAWWQFDSEKMNQKISSANATLIVTAVNNHAKLVGMVAVLVDMIDDLRPHSDRVEAQARELLANVKEGTL